MVTIPMYFMFAVTFCSLGQLIYANLGKNWLIVGISAGLAVLSAALFIEAYRGFSNDKGQIRVTYKLKIKSKSVVTHS